MATPKITNLDNVNKTYMADGVQYALDPSTNRFAIASTIKPVPNATIQNASPITIPPTNISQLPAQLPQTQDFINAQSENKTVEQNLTQNNLDLQKLQNELSGKSADQLALEQQQGIPQISQKVLDLQALADQKALEYNLTPYSLQGQGRGITTGILRGQEAVKQRQLAVEGIFANAQLKAAQGNLQLAQSQVDRALTLKYEPILAKIDAQKQIIENSKFMLSRSDKKLADAKQAELDRQKQEQEQKREEEKGIQNIVLTLAKYGVPQSVMQSVASSSSLNDALIRAGSNLQDPQAKMELESIRLDQVLKKAQIQRQYRETQLLGEPSTAETKATAQAIKEAKSSIPVMQDKIDTINILKDHSGLSSRVGTGILTRTPTGTLGALGKVGTVAGLATLPGDIKSKLTGSGQDFAGGVHKLVGGLTLQSLIDAKARGATFGALSEGELNILANSASAINDWELKDDKGKGLGVWNIDEKSFKKELDTIQNLTRRALLLSQGNQFTPDEQTVLDEMYGQSTQVDASAYFK